MSEEVKVDNMSDLQKFNDRVIQKIGESVDSSGKVQLLGIDMTNPNIAITHLNLGNVPALVIIKLTEDSTGKVPLYDRVSEVVMTLTIGNISAVNKIMNWCTIIHNNLQSMELNNYELSEVV